VIDPTSGMLATEYCPVVLTEVFREGTVPTHLCNQHQSYWEQEIAEAANDGDTDGTLGDGIAVGDEQAGGAADAHRERRPRTFRNWLRRVFGDEKNRQGEEPPNQDKPPRP
jgi:hypothetical protein